MEFISAAWARMVKFTEPNIISYFNFFSGQGGMSSVKTSSCTLPINARHLLLLSESIVTDVMSNAHGMIL